MSKLVLTYNVTDEPNAPVYTLTITREKTPEYNVELGGTNGESGYYTYFTALTGDEALKPFVNFVMHCEKEGKHYNVTLKGETK